MYPKALWSTSEGNSTWQILPSLFKAGRGIFGRKEQAAAHMPAPLAQDHPGPRPPWCRAWQSKCPPRSLKLVQPKRQYITTNKTEMQCGRCILENVPSLAPRAQTKNKESIKICVQSVWNQWSLACLLLSIYFCNLINLVVALRFASPATTQKQNAICSGPEFSTRTGIHTLSSAANTNATKGCVCLARVSIHTGSFLANSGSATKGGFVDAGVERSTRGRNASHSSALWLDDANNHQCHWRLLLWWAGRVCLGFGPGDAVQSYQGKPHVVLWVFGAWLDATTFSNYVRKQWAGDGVMPRAPDFATMAIEPPSSCVAS